MLILTFLMNTNVPTNTHGNLHMACNINANTNIHTKASITTNTKINTCMNISITIPSDTSAHILTIVSTLVLKLI